MWREFVLLIGESGTLDFISFSFSFSFLRVYWNVMGVVY